MDIFIWFPFRYVNFNAQKLKIMIRKQVHIHLSYIDPKIKIFRDFRVFVLRPILKNYNSKITEILEKCHHTEMWECSFKSSWNAVQMKSNSKSFSHIPNLVAVIWGFLNLLTLLDILIWFPFRYVTFKTQKVAIVIGK